MGWCVSQHAMGQAGGVYPKHAMGQVGAVSQHAMGQARGVVCIPVCNWAAGCGTGDTHPTGMHPC